MSPDQRREAIIALVRAAQRASVEDLAAHVGASRETVRRDLAELDGRGLLRKVHGGAVTIEPGLPGPAREGSFAARMAQHIGAKRAIAAVAARLLAPGDSVFIDTGTTTIVFAEELARCKGLTIITNSAAVASLAAKGEGAEVFLLGGAYRRGGQESVGELAIEQIGRFRTAHAMLTVAAVSEAGYMDFDFAEAQVARAMARQAAAVTVLADASKLGRSGAYEVGPPGMARRLVTDAIEPGLHHALAAAGVEVMVTGHD